MTTLLLALWPLFALIVAGYFMRRHAFPSEAFWPGAERINYFVLFPALLFNSLASAPLDNPQLPHLAAAVLLGLGLAWAVLLLLRRLRGWPAARFGPITQGGLRFNTYLGLAAVGSLYGQQGLALAALMLALMVPTVNVMSVWALTAERGVSARALLMPIARNPLILACVGGGLFNLAGFSLPGGSDRLLGLLAAASLPLGLLCVGAALQPAALRRDGLTLTATGGLRLLLMPILAALIARAFGLTGTEALVLIVFSAIPTAPTSYVLTRQLGGDGTLMAGIVTSQTLAAIATIPLVLWLLTP